MKKTMLALILVMAASLIILCAGCSSGQSSAQKTAYTHLEAEEAAAMINSGECVLIDVRSSEEYKTEHIPGSLNISYDSPDSDFTSVLSDRDQAIVLYCDYGGTSKDVAERLCGELGYTNVYEFDGLLVWEGDTVSGD